MIPDTDTLPAQCSGVHDMLYLSLFMYSSLSLSLSFLLYIHPYISITPSLSVSLYLYLQFEHMGKRCPLSLSLSHVPLCITLPTLLLFSSACSLPSFSPSFVLSHQLCFLLPPPPLSQTLSPSAHTVFWNTTVSA